MYIEHNEHGTRTHIRLDKIQQRLERQKEKLVNLNNQINSLLDLRNELENSIKDIDKMLEISTHFVLPSDVSWEKKND